MSSNVLFKKVATSDEVAQCTENQIVFCEEDLSVHTHSTRYGSPVLTQIGNEDDAGDIQMQPVTLSMKSRSQSNEDKPMNLSSSLEFKEMVVDIQPGYIRYNGSPYSLEDFKSLSSVNKSLIEGVYVSPDLITEIKDYGIYEWGLMGTSLNVSGFKSLSSAIQDMSGRYNCDVISKSSSSNVFKDGLSNGWYIPSLGELNLTGLSFDSIQNSLDLVGTRFITSYYWSSTPGSDSRSAWAYNFEKLNGQLGYRSSKLAIRRFKKV